MFKEVTKLPSVVLSTLSIFKEKPDPLTDCLNVKCQFEAILVKGRYLKLSREVSQSPWHVKEAETGTKIESVQTLLGEAIREEIFGADEVLLHGSGREDIDVRMLGRGRPFILEFINPRKGVTCHQRAKEMS